MDHAGIFLSVESGPFDRLGKEPPGKRRGSTSVCRYGSSSIAPTSRNPHSGSSFGSDSDLLPPPLAVSMVTTLRGSDGTIAWCTRG